MAYQNDDIYDDTMSTTTQLPLNRCLSLCLSFMCFCTTWENSEDGHCFFSLNALPEDTRQIESITWWQLKHSLFTKWSTVCNKQHPEREHSMHCACAARQRWNRLRFSWPDLAGNPSVRLASWQATKIVGSCLAVDQQKLQHLDQIMPRQTGKKQYTLQ